MELKECVNDEKCCGTCDFMMTEESFNDVFPYCFNHNFRLSEDDLEMVCDDWEGDEEEEVYEDDCGFCGICTFCCDDDEEIC